MDDQSRDPEEEDKDTRLQFIKPQKGVTALQAKMLRMAGQPVPALIRDEKKQDRSDGEEDTDEEETEEAIPAKRVCYVVMIDVAMIDVAAQVLSGHTVHFITCLQ